jgi:hypothetical protein
VLATAELFGQHVVRGLETALRPPLLHDETFSQRVRAALRIEIGDDAVDALLSASRTSSKEWGGEEHWSPGVLQLSARHMAQTIASAQRLVATLATQYVKRKQLEMQAAQLQGADLKGQRRRRGDRLPRRARRRD